MREWRFWILLTVVSTVLLFVFATTNVISGWAGGTSLSIFMYIAAVCGGLGTIWLIRHRGIFEARDQDLSS